MHRTNDITDARALAYEENEALERKRSDPNWRPGVDPTQTGPRLMLSREAMAIDSCRPRNSFRIYQPPIAQYRQPQPPVQNPAPTQQCDAQARRFVHHGQRIHDLRRALRWTQRDMAAHLGISVRTVIRHERSQSRRPQLRVLLRLRDLESAYAADFAALPAD